MVEALQLGPNHEHLPRIIRKVTYATPTKPPGRPTVMTPLVIGKLEAAFAFDLNIKEACFYAGINPDTYYTFVKENPEYSERFEALRQQPVIMMKQAVLKHGVENYSYAMDYLKRKNPTEFGDRSTQKVELSGQVDSTVTDGNVVNAVTKQLSDEYLTKFKDALKDGHKPKTT